MSDGKIYITISDSRGGSGVGVSNAADTEKDKKSTVGQYLQHRFFNFIQGQASQFVNYSINNIGNFTGDYQTQRNVQTMMSAVNFFINTFSEAITGAQAGGVAGALAGITIAVGSQVINFGYSELSEQFQNRKVNRNIDMMRKRLGLEGLTDGSRTGGY